MTDISATIRLRPTRIGFLVKPNDLASIRTILRYNACVWGGVFNPIIPVYRTPPIEWRHEHFRPVSGKDVAQGYVRFFEPDVYVEAEKGLLEQAELKGIRQEHTFDPHVITLKEFLKPEGKRTWSEPYMGLSISDVLRHIYKTERRFTLRDEQKAIFVKPVTDSLVSEAIFGVYPTLSHASHIGKNYKAAFKPEELEANPKTWLQVFKKNAETPLGVTDFGLEIKRQWHHEPVVFVFDPRRGTDVIDLWNMRLEPNPVLPMPIDWFEPLAKEIFQFLKSEHRPIQDNPQGLMHNATVEFSRSITEARRNETIAKLPAGLPQGALVVKPWRNPIWVYRPENHGPRYWRADFTAQEKSVTIQEKGEKERSITIETLSPPFASRYGGRHHRFANVVKLSTWGYKQFATLLPFNTFDISWPRIGLGDRVVIGSEGWVFTKRYTGLNQYIQLLSPEDAVKGALEKLGIKSKLSEPGYIAKQMLEHVGGVTGAYLLADLETLQLLNKMAGGVRRKNNETETFEENFELRTAPRADWTSLIARRKQRESLGRFSLSKFTDANILRLGLEIECPNCKATNWSSLSNVDYRITCDRCLKSYEFPQADLKENNRNWTYRVIGPFSLPDYGRGSYSSLLALRFIQEFGVGREDSTFVTATQLEFDSKHHEVDFIMWRESGRGDEVEPPQLIIGETKSAGTGQLIKSKDLATLKAVATKLPGAIVVIGVMRDHFLDSEKKILTSFVKWARRLDVYGEPTNPVVLLTSRELFMQYHLETTWKKAGEPYKNFASFHHTRTLREIAQATQSLYLDMPSFYSVRNEQFQRRLARRKGVDL